MGLSHRSLVATLVLCAACAGSGNGVPNPSPDADPYRPDARIPQCQANSALVGRCELAQSGDCTGVPDEERIFVPLSQGDEVSMVLGPQASLMFVLALQTDGIHPGDPDNPASSDNANVEITLLLGDSERMAHYRGRPYFEVDPGNAQMLDATGLFVIVEASASALDGQSVTAIAELTDRDGIERCGSVTFVARK